MHIRLNHAYIIPWSQWNSDMKTRRKKEWDAIIRAGEKKRKPQQSQLKITDRVPVQSRPNVALDLPKVVAKGIALGLLPINFARNPGFTFILRSIFLNISLDGLNGRTVSRRLIEEYKLMIEQRKQYFNKLFEMLDGVSSRGDAFVLKRKFHIQFDIWTNRKGDSFLGITISFFDTSNPVEWKWKHVCLGCIPFSERHTALNTREKIEAFLKKLGFSSELLATCAMDTTNSSFNTFDNDLFIEQIPCIAHLLSLHMNHSIERCECLRELFRALQTLMSRLKGNNSSKRKALLEQKCRENNIPPRAAKILVKTRWNHTRDLGQRYLEIEGAIAAITDADFGPSRADDQQDENARESWEDLKESARVNRQLLLFIMPYLDDVSRWTQILSSRYFLTISKVRLCYYSLHKNLAELRIKADESAFSNTMKTKVDNALNSFGTELTSYISKVSKYALFLIAEFLDPQTFILMSSDHMKEAFIHMEVFCSEDEYFSPKEINERKRAAAREMRRSSRGTGDRVQVQEPAAEETFEAFLQEGLSTVSPIKVELGRFVPLVKSLGIEQRNPFKFWATEGNKFPILRRLALKILSANVTSADVERLFSRGGIICSNLRSLLKPDTVLTLTSLHYFYREEEDIIDSRSISSTNKSTRFASLQMDMAIRDGDYNDDQSDSDSDLSSVEE